MSELPNDTDMLTFHSDADRDVEVGVDSFDWCSSSQGACTAIRDEDNIELDDVC